MSMDRRPASFIPTAARLVSLISVVLVFFLAVTRVILVILHCSKWCHMSFF